VNEFVVTFQTFQDLVAILFHENHEGNVLIVQRLKTKMQFILNFRITVVIR